MKKLILSLNLILTLCFGSNIDDTINAYNIILLIFQKLVDKNDSLAHQVYLACHNLGLNYFRRYGLSQIYQSGRIFFKNLRWWISKRV